jgi:hypothetical protein
MSGDGRLDLDDLGQVVDNATPLGADLERDEIAGGDEGPTWSERTAPVRGWLRRHRVLVVAVTAGALLLGFGAAGWNARQPPPPATDVAVTLAFDVAEFGIEFVEESVVRLVIRAQPRRAGDTVRVTGLIGTGLAASRATQTGADTFEVRAVIDCGIEPGLATGTVATQHLVEVETADAYGRTLRDAVPMVGVSDTLGYQLNQHCATYTTRTGVVPRVASVRRAGDDLELTVSVRNDTPHTVLLTPGQDNGSVVVTAPGIAVPPGRERFWELRLMLTDCADPRTLWVTPDGVMIADESISLLTEGDPGNAAEPFVDVQTSLMPSAPFDEAALGSSYQATTGVPIRLGGVRPALRQWARDLCAGADPVTATLRPDGQPISRTTAVSPDEKTLPVTLAVRLPSGRVTVGPDVAVGNNWGSSLATRDAPEVLWEGFEGTGGRTVTVRLLWLFTCTGDLSPPRLAATVRADGRVSPWRIPLDGYRLADALRRACPIQVSSTQDLTDWGWDLSDRPILPLT